MSDSGNSTCGSECDSGCGSEFDSMPIPFTLKVTDAEPLEFSEEGLGMRVDTLTLLEGEDCVVYQEDPEFGRICLGRLIHPYTLNLAVQMEDYMPEMKIVCESKTPCTVAVTGCLQEEDEGSLSGDDESMEDGTAGESGVDIEEVEESVPALVGEPATKDEEMASSDEEELDAGDTSEDNEEEEAPVVVEQQPKSPQEKKKEIAVQKQPAKKEAPAAKKPVAKPTPAAKPAADETPKASPEPAKATAKASPAPKAEAEEAKTGIRKQLGRGLAYEVLEVGKGPLAQSGKQATVKYVLTLARTGQKMDAGVLKFRVGAGEVVQGFDKGVKGMCVGEKRRISVPSELGYGKKKTGKIPAGSDLIFEVTLQSVKQ